MESYYQKLGFLALDTLKLGSSKSDNSQENNRKIQRSLEKIEYRLWQELITEELKEKYEEFKSNVKSILIRSNEPSIPWEIIKPKKEPFWYEQFAMSLWITEPGSKNIMSH